MLGQNLFLDRSKWGHRVSALVSFLWGWRWLICFMPIEQHPNRHVSPEFPLSIFPSGALTKDASRSPLSGSMLIDGRVHFLSSWALDFLGRRFER